MVNFNGTLIENQISELVDNRAFLYGDAVFETLKIVNNKILYLEDHYFRLMSSMRILRMKIPMSFTMEFLETEILSLANHNICSNSARVRLTIFRNPGGFYLPTTNQISYLIKVSAVKNQLYTTNTQQYEVDLYKDFYVSKQLISTLKTTNKLINITASIFASENDLQNCILLNDAKNVVEATNGNLFLVTNNTLITPPISEGCLNGIMRKQVLNAAKTIDNLTVLEQIISPFDLQKADELFVTNIISGIQPITKYRKKEFEINISLKILEKINQTLGL